VRAAHFEQLIDRFVRRTALEHETVRTSAMAQLDQIAPSAVELTVLGATVRAAGVERARV
jgi:hypothetical protein